MSKPKTQMIDLRDIVVQPNRMRQLHPEVVDEVAASIASEGLLTRMRTETVMFGGVAYGDREKLHQQIASGLKKRRPRR